MYLCVYIYILLEKKSGELHLSHLQQEGEAEAEAEAPTNHTKEGTNSYVAIEIKSFSFLCNLYYPIFTFVKCDKR